MAEESPWFKFNPYEYYKGNITLCSYQAQGIFINLCGYYWGKRCEMPLANAKQRFSKCLDLLDELKTHGVFTIDKKNFIHIKFLDEQKKHFEKVSKSRAISGSEGGKAKVSKCQANLSIYINIINYLNKKAEKRFSPKTKSTVEFINGRLNDGFTEKDFYKVIDNKVAHWKDDSKMNMYLRPETLFRPTHFESYLNENHKPKNNGLVY